MKVKKLIFVCGFYNYLGINEEYDAVDIKTIKENNLVDLNAILEFWTGGITIILIK